MKYEHLVLILLFAGPGILFGQNKLLFGSWVKTKIETVGGKTTPNIEEADKMFIRFTFKDKGKAYRSITPSEQGEREREREEIDYKLFDDIIEMGSVKLKVEKCDSVTLVVVQLENGMFTDNCIRLYFIREEALDRKISVGPDDFYITGTDTIYFESLKVYPRFTKGDCNFRSFVRIRTGYNPNELMAYATFLVDIEGKVSNLILQHHVDKNYDKNLESAILRTNGGWIPPIVNGKKVKCLMSISFIQSAQITSVPLYSEEYYRQFNMATRQLISGKFEEALAGFMGCATLTKDDSNTLFQQSICYDKLNDIRHRTICREKVRISKFSYLVKGK